MALALALQASALKPNSLSDIAQLLDASGSYADTCTYEVLLPSLSEPVTYSISLESEAAPADTLAPCHYIISWSLPAPSGISKGFSAYFDGAHFRFRDTRLQEYHTEEGLEPFAPGGNPLRGVQQQVQFAELLPQFIAAKLRRMEADSTYIYTVTADSVVDGRHSTVVEGLQRASGYDGNEFTYIFDATTMLPLRIELENNPGQIGEQSIAVSYSGSPSKPSGHIDLATLSAANAEAFEKYRSSNFSLETLPGLPLPEIAAATLGGERYSHHRGEALAAPTVVVFFDTTVATTPEVINSVREALAMLPRQVDVVWGFLDHRADDVQPLVPRALPGETTLLHASGAARNCGVGALTPVIIFAKSDGTVSDFIRGFNQDLTSLVIDKASVII